MTRCFSSVMTAQNLSAQRCKTGLQHFRLHRPSSDVAFCQYRCRFAFQKGSSCSYCPVDQQGANKQISVPVKASRQHSYLRRQPID